MSRRVREDVMESDDEQEDVEMEEAGDGQQKTPKAYIPGVSRPLKEGEELDFDPDAYRLFHTFETTYPCLSFDVLRDELGENRTDFPHQAFIVTATQSEQANKNELLVLGLKNLLGIETEKEDSEDESNDEEEDEEKNAKKQPILHSAVIPQRGECNRIRATRIGDSSVCAIWNAMMGVQIWNVTAQFKDVVAREGPTSSAQSNNEKPLFAFRGHKGEGFALAWSPTKQGRLATGGQDKALYVWNMAEGGQWSVDQRGLPGHVKSVEDVQWSPSEEALLVSASSDGSIRLWDTRVAPKEACVCVVQRAHDSDVNVLDWNRHDALIATGGDDAELKIWSLKTIQYGEPVARFKHHVKPITSVEWHPTDSTTLMASGEDDQTSIWDLAVEADVGAATDETPGVPPQLMFLHCGQKEVKEIHWHPQITGLALTTSLTGFNVFRTINI